MSSTRSRQSLGGNNCLAENAIAQLGLEGRRRYQVHAVSDELAELSLEADELKQANRAVEFDEQVDVAVVSPQRPG